MLTENGGGDHRRRLSRVHYNVQCTVYNARWRNNALQTMLQDPTQRQAHAGSPLFGLKARIKRCQLHIKQRMACLE